MSQFEYLAEDRITDFELVLFSGQDLDHQSQVDLVNEVRRQERVIGRQVKALQYLQDELDKARREYMLLLEAQHRPEVSDE